jgi:hypothetical protein
MPRIRFRLQTLMVFPIAVALIISLWAALTPAVPLSGGRDVTLDFRVIDAANGKSVADALVRVSDPFDEQKKAESRTRRDGEARLTHSFEVKGEQRTFRTSGIVSFEDGWLEVSARGFITLIVPLANLTGKQRGMNDPSPPLIKVALRQGIPPSITVGDLVGSYYRGDGLGMNCRLRILPEDRFSFGWSGCLGMYARNYGSARQVDGPLTLYPVKANSRKDFGTATRFLPVRWGERQYLIPEEDALDFCNAVNRKTEPRDDIHGMFYLRDNDWEKKVTGFPQLPSQWISYLLKEPVSGEVVQILQGGRALISLGSKDGIREGMELIAHGEGLFCTLKVVDVQADSCSVTPEYPEERNSLKKGQKVTSGLLEEYAVGADSQRPRP